METDSSIGGRAQVRAQRGGSIEIRLQTREHPDD